VEELAEAGEIWFTEAVYWVADRSLVPFEELGYRDLRGLPEKARLFRVPRSPRPGAPPFEGAGLAFVAGLGEPSPERLARRLRRHRPLLRRSLLALAGVALLGAAGLGLQRLRSGEVPAPVPVPAALVPLAPGPEPSAPAGPASAAEPAPATAPLPAPAVKPKTRPKPRKKAKASKTRPEPARGEATPRLRR
jgi:hypothetical protein